MWAPGCKVVAAVLRVAGVLQAWQKVTAACTTGFMTHVTYRLTAKNRDQLQNRTLGNRVWATFFIVSGVGTGAAAA